MLSTLPPEWPDDLLPEIRHQVRDSQRKVVVLDDDPTGTQTVYGIPVLTEWSVTSLAAELIDDAPAVYLLTNSRSMPLDQAQAVNREIGRNLIAASQQTQRDFVVVSRSDSTLRGHFPGETDALLAALGDHVDGQLIVPFFLEGERYTIDDIHYVAEDAWLIPAAETPFARDAAFGFQNSNLRNWVEEKTAGQVRAEDVVAISIEDIRRGGPSQVTQQLMGLTDGAMCTVNAAAMRDMEVLVGALLATEAQGKRYLYRTAASFVQTRAGLVPKPILTRSDLDLPTRGGGLIVVGSYVPKTTSQVNALLDRADVIGVEIRVNALLSNQSWRDEIERVTRLVNHALAHDEDVAIYTSRELVTGKNSVDSLAIGQRVSTGLVAIVQAISSQPRYILAKGGITSSDVATAGLGVKRAMVRGQILPGVPVWQLGPESRHPGLTYIVFPGNVGGPEALVEVVDALKNRSYSVKN